MSRYEDDALSMEFRQECRQLLDETEKLLLIADESHILTQEAVKELFRFVHTLKSSSAMAGFSELSERTHRFENLLSRARDYVKDGKTLSYARLDGIITAGYSFAELFRASVAADDDSEYADKTAVIDKFETKLSASLAQWGEKAIQIAAEETKKPDRQYLCDIRVFLGRCDSPSLRAYMLYRAVMRLCENSATEPESLTRSENADEVIARDGFILRFTPKEGQTKESILAVLRRQLFFERYQELSGKATPSETRREERLLSIKQSELNALIDRIAEIRVAQKRMAEYLIERHENTTETDNLLIKAQRDAVFVQNSLRKAGMAEINDVFGKINLLIRKLLRECGKSASVKTEGGEISIDQSLVELLGEALTHIARNAVDHGLESPEERASAKKSAEGSIALSAVQKQGRIIVTISDDGRGIDRDEILNKAEKMKLLTKPRDEYTDEEVTGFLIVSGFSTSARVTENSGRGVGLDAVKASLEKIGGSLSIKGERGRGAAFTLDIPVTLSLTDAVAVTVDGRRFYLPLHAVESVKLLDAGQKNQNGAISYEGDCLRYFGLGEYRRGGICALVKHRDKRYYMPCDSIEESRTVIVKELPAALKKLLGEDDCYYGCCINESGNAYCILNPNKWLDFHERRVNMKLFNNSGEINPDFADMLGEIGNVGIGRATTALGKLIGQRLALRQPEITLADEAHANIMKSINPDNIVMGIVMAMEKKPSGIVMFIFDYKIVQDILLKVTGKRYDEPAMLEDEYAVSAIEELANSMAASYMTAIGAYTGLRLYLRPVMCGIDKVMKIVSASLSNIDSPEDKSVCIQTAFDFMDEKDRVGGHVLIIPDHDSLEIFAGLVE